LPTREATTVDTKERIEQSIRANCPIIFGDSDAVDTKAFKQKYDDLVDSAVTASAPFLGAETVRYQSMLLYFSLLLLAVSLFQIGQVKIGESVVSVDRRLLVIYTLFIGAIILTFLTKVYVDYQRARFLLHKNDQVSLELREMVSVGVLKKRIQYHFWLEIFDAIGRAYQTYDDALSAALGTASEFKPIPMQMVPLDRVSLSKSPELKEEIENLNSYLAVLGAELTRDENRVREEADRIVSTMRSQLKDDPVGLYTHQACEAIRAVNGQTLQIWLDARNHLTDQVLDGVVRNDPPELIQLNAMLAVLKRRLKTRRIYTGLEVVTPVAFAIFATLYVYFASLLAAKPVVTVVVP
jgi:hypothetical protein